MYSSHLCVYVEHVNALPRLEIADLKPAGVSSVLSGRVICVLRPVYFEMSCTKDPEVPDKRKITIWPQWLAALASKFFSLLSKF